MSMGVVYYQTLALARSRAARPERNGNGTEMQRWCADGMKVIERQTAELAFRFDGTERKRHRFYASYCKWAVSLKCLGQKMKG